MRRLREDYRKDIISTFAFFPFHFYSHLNMILTYNYETWNDLY